MTGLSPRRAGCPRVSLHTLREVPSPHRRPSPSPHKPPLLPDQLLPILRFLLEISTAISLLSPISEGMVSVQHGGGVSWQTGRRLDLAESLQEVGGESSASQRSLPVCLLS